MEADHIPAKVIQLLCVSYDGAVSIIHVQDELSAEFPIHSGVWQGNVALSLLFNIVVDVIMQQVFSQWCDVQFGVDGYVTNLMFANDSAIFADTDAEATNCLYDIACIAESYGLKINANKTKVLTSDGSLASVQLNGAQIEQVREFKYLGSLVQEKKTASSADIHSQIGQAASAFASLKWCVCVCGRRATSASTQKSAFIEH